MDAAGKVRSALSIAGPAYRMTRARLELLGPEVAEAARRTGAQLPLVQHENKDAAVLAVDGPWAFHGAFPQWCERRQQLCWADALAPSLRCYAEGRDVQVTRLDKPVTGLLLQGDDVWVAHDAGILVCKPDGSHQMLDTKSAEARQTICQGEDGTIWAASNTIDGGSVVGILSPDGNLAIHWRYAETLQCVRWRSEDQTLYTTVPTSGTILKMQPGSSAIRRLGNVLKGSGQVSGLAFDTSGGIWTALRDGWSVVRFTADGSLDRVVGLPVPCPTDLTFGGPAMDRLFVTTPRHSVGLNTLANAPLSGRLFVLDV